MILNYSQATYVYNAMTMLNCVGGKLSVTLPRDEYPKDEIFVSEKKNGQIRVVCDPQFEIYGSQEDFRAAFEKEYPRS